ILGSATPSLETLMNVKNSKYGFVVLDKRFGGVMLPEIKTIDLKEAHKKKKIKDDLSFDLIKNIKKGDLFVLLDESGTLHSSKEFAKFLTKKYNSNHKKLIFIIGGPFGFAESIYSLKAEKISLSKMTFTHQMSRLFFCEQLYRANTILKNGNYHHK
ncbi:23S rRNA (pseudouridine(1915)-N(3))-methyltransferase RlmH, partial [Flavobacteriaceae bacterium]|nr:23S rRNA (pseudouridine(1915)-N(3))-methyltransferase RlmH [Flavobacteriaceae bacterium]